MSFNSLAFALFMPVVFLIHWLVLPRRAGWQNGFLLAASYMFYGWWDWRFCGLILGVTAVSYACALPQSHRKAWTALSVVCCVLTLCVFKYFNFFGDNLQLLFATFGIAIDWFTVEILLPVGISFYTFQAISYSVDVYRGKIRPAHNFADYALYISFFPQLVAGPIERASALLPQFYKARQWDYSSAVQGARLILWGLFKKCVVADGCAYWVACAWDQHTGWGDFANSFWCTLGVIGFALQVYGDFSGYSDIAKGSAKLLGIRLMDNFRYPFFSRNGIEFWQRWHRSLMQWLREYVYFPLGGSRRGNKWLNIMIVFLISGLWHGADWTFVTWGVLNGIWYLIAAAGHAKNYKSSLHDAGGRADLPKMAVSTILFAFTLIFFRAPSVDDALIMIESSWKFGLITVAALILLAYLLKYLKFITLRLITIVSAAVIGLACLLRPAATIPSVLGFFGFLAAAVMLMAEWRGRRHHFALETMPRRAWLRIGCYTVLYLLIFVCSISADSIFIYYKF